LKLYGFYSLEVENGVFIYIVAMGNVINTLLKIDEKYDMKGCKN